MQQHRNANNHSPMPVITGAPLDGPADCTLACDEGHLTAHKIMLCAHSKYLQDILGKFPNAEHPIIILTELNITDIKILVNYMYTGELVITNDGSPSSLLRAAQILKIDSLTDFDDDDDQQQQRPGSPQGVSGRQQDQQQQQQQYIINNNNNNNHLNQNQLNNNSSHSNHYQQSPSPSISPTPSPSPPPYDDKQDLHEQLQLQQQRQQQMSPPTAHHNQSSITTNTRSRLSGLQHRNNHRNNNNHNNNNNNNNNNTHHHPYPIKNQPISKHNQKLKQRSILPPSISPSQIQQSLPPPSQSPPNQQQSASVHHSPLIKDSNNKIKCHLCNIGLSDVKCLYRHVLTRHLPEKWGYKCEFCDREFSRDDHLMRHYTTKHKNMDFNREKIRETRRLNREMAKNFHDQISKMGIAGLEDFKDELSL